VAQENRQLFRAKGTFAINLMSSPGSGKTLILEQTLRLIHGKLSAGVIEGDICSTLDSERLSKFDVPVVQINTQPFGGDCHLDARMIKAACESLDLPALDVLFIENVGNLVCPAEFDLGENVKVAVISVTEGVDKPLKYPLIFRVSDLVLINKTDLLPYLDVDVDQLYANIARVNPRIPNISLSAKTKDGLDTWVEWLTAQISNHKGTRKSRAPAIASPSPSLLPPGGMIKVREGEDLV
jgi:hydrogenase nickel incorporation protein HypB